MNIDKINIEQIKNFIEEGEKEFDKGYYTFRFEFTDLDGKRKFKVCYWSDGIPKEEALKNVHNYIYGFKNAKLTDFTDNSYVKQFITSRQISLIKMIVEMIDGDIKKMKEDWNPQYNLELQDKCDALDTISSKLKELTDGK
jgi:hypothetical protein